MKKLQMFENKNEGLLVTFCGLDGSGKTTMIKRLIKYLEEAGEDHFLTKQPTQAVRSSEIFRNYMDQPDHTGFDYRSLSLLAASDRVQHSNMVIIPELKKGKIVVSDRYFYSCLANLQARGFEKDKWIYEISKSIVKPDISFFMEISVEKALERVRSRPEEKEKFVDIGLQFRLKDNYEKICKQTNGVLIPSDVSEDESFEIVKNTFEEQRRKKKWKLKKK